MLIIREVYCVHQGDSDRDPGTPEWAFADQDIANLVAAKAGWYGGNAPVSAQQAAVDDVTGECHIILKTVTINHGPNNATEEVVIEDLRQKAIAKLSAAERKLLEL